MVLLPKVDGRDGVDHPAERLTAGLEQPFHLGSTTVHLGGSVGRAVSPDDGSAYSDLLAHADASMYDIKRTRTGRRRARTP